MEVVQVLVDRVVDVVGAELLLEPSVSLFQETRPLAKGHSEEELETFIRRAGNEYIDYPGDQGFAWFVDAMAESHFKR